MEMRFFAIPALNPAQAEEEVNRLCTERRVVAVDRQFVAAGHDSFWAVCMTLAPGAGALPDSLKTVDRRAGNGKAAAARVDYKEVLSEAEFAVFADLRAWRKAAADQEGVPIYAVFTNEQLAEIARRRVDTLAGLGGIDGIGQARLDRYGPAVLARMQAFRDGPAGG